MTTRNDVHRVSAFRPDDYEFLFDFASVDFPDPGFNVALLRTTRTGQVEHDTLIYHGPDGRLVTERIPVQPRFGKLNHFTGDSFRCDCCGSHYKYGSLLRHRTSGEAITLGHICADKAGMHTNHSYVKAYQKRCAEARKTRRANAQRRQCIREWVKANPEQVALLKVDHRIARSMRARLIDTGARWGLSDKQVALLRKLRDDLVKRERDEPKVNAPVTDDRIRLMGTVVSAKTNDWGRYVMTVKVVETDGCWLTWGTVPGNIDVERGTVVSFVAKIVVSDRDPSFSFFKRPTQAKVVENGVAHL